MTVNIKTLVDAYATRVDFVDYNIAADINNLQVALEALANMTFSQAGFSNVETLAATKTLTDDSAVVQMLNPNSADRDVSLPALAVTNHPFLVGNTNGSNYLLTVKNAGGTVIRIVPPGKFFLFFSDGNQWFYSGSDIYKTISPAQITADQNDYNPTSAYESDILRINSDAARNITGLAGGSAGRIKIVHNVGSFAITLKDESASSTAANRFAFVGDVVLAADQSVFLIYDTTSSRWRLAGFIGDVTATGTQTITNKRIQKRAVTVTQSATPTINTDNGDIFNITGLAQAITSMTTNLSGTPVDGEMILIQITDNGTARAITWGASFASTSANTLPSTTVLSKRLRVLLQYNGSLWECVGSTSSV